MKRVTRLDRRAKQVLAETGERPCSYFILGALYTSMLFENEDADVWDNETDDVAFATAIKDTMTLYMLISARAELERMTHDA